MGHSVDKGHQYRALDALRGVAALLVVAYHTELLFGVLTPKSAYLAVDLFFCLSGFVIAHAYGARLGAGMSFSAFAKIRTIRLYPLYLLGLGAAALLEAVRILFGLTGPKPGLLEAGGMNLLGLPSVTTETMYPLNGPSWSLLYEMIANLVAALIWPWLGRRALIGLCVLNGLLLALVSFVYSGVEDVGQEYVTFLAGLTRVFFPFFMGVLIYQLQLKVPRISLWVLIPAFVVMAYIQPGQMRWLYDAVATLVVVPLFVILGSQRLASNLPLDTAGRLSYAVYMLHVPAWHYFQAALKPLGLTPQPGLLTIAYVVILLAGCWLVDRLIDVPVRNWLRSRLISRPAPA